MKKKEKKIKQREIWLCDLSKDSIDSEVSFNHPVIVVSANIRNTRSSNVVVFPITSARKKYQPSHHFLYNTKYDFFEKSTNTVLCEEIRSISKNRLYYCLGIIDEIDFEEIMIKKEYIFYEKKY